MAGDPDLESTALMIAALAECGADAIELGIPYGDPLADGPTIAAAGVRALARGTNVDSVLDLVRAMREESPPIVLFTYYNPVLQYGIGRFAGAAREAGASGAIIPDVALEESAAVRGALAENELAMPLLVAPTTPRERAARIASQSTGFVYVVSRLGVTGAADAPDFTPLLAHVAELRALTNKPLAVGFGISRREHVEGVGASVDGIIVGSAVIEAYGESRGAAAAARLTAFVHELFGG